MEKTPKYRVIFTVILFLTLLITFYVLGYLVENPVSSVTVIVLALLAINLPVIFPQWQISNLPLRKRRKRILINLGIYITFTLIMFIILYLKLGRTPFQNKSVILLWFVPIPFMLYNLFFPKDEEQKDTDETKMNN